MRMALATVLALMLAPPPSAADAMQPASLSTGRLGNVFAPGEPIDVTIANAAGSAAWRVKDHRGNVVARGQAMLGNGTGLLPLPELRPGYFELTVEPADCAPACTAQLALAVVPAAEGGEVPFGAMTHIGHGWAPDFLPLLKRIGVGHVRDEQYWAEVEKQPGVFQFSKPYVDYMEALAGHGIRPLLEMTFANPLYDGGTTPTSPTARAAYGRFGQALVERYPDQVTALEVWNEINGSWCDGACPADRIGTYVGLLDAAWNAVKRRTPTVTMVGGATAGVPLPWWRKLAERGGLRHLDVVSVHSYPHDPEAVDDEIGGLRTIMRAHGGEKPIWVTETGRWGGLEAERHQSAEWLIKQLTMLRSTGVERIYWYLARDAEDVDGMGLLRGPDSRFGAYAPNPSYVAFATLIRELGGAELVRRERTDPRTRLYLFNRLGTEVRVAWSSAGTSELSFSSDEPLLLYDSQGRPSLIDDGRLPLGTDPVFIIGRARLERERRADRLLADITPTVQAPGGGGGWRYGYRALMPGEPVGRTNEAVVDLEPLTVLEDDWSTYWGDPSRAHLKLDSNFSHPATDGERQLWAVRRWTASAPAPVSIVGEAELDSSSGDGVDVIVTLDGVRVDSRRLLPGERWDFHRSAVVRKGSVLDVAVTPGPALNDSFDATRLKIAVTTPVDVIEIDGR